MLMRWTGARPRSTRRSGPVRLRTATAATSTWRIFQRRVPRSTTRRAQCRTATVFRCLWNRGGSSGSGDLTGGRPVFARHASRYLACSRRQSRCLRARLTGRASARYERAQLHEEVPGHEQRAGREDDVSGHPHPLPEERRVIELLAAGVGETVLIHCIELRPADREEIEEDPEDKPRVVEPEGPATRRLAEA